MPVYRRALITGSTSGIGQAFACELPPRTDLLLTGRNVDRLEVARVELRRPGREVRLVAADLALIGDREALIAAAEAFEIDLLINNAGLGAYGPVLENDADVERAAAEVNVVATSDLTRRMLPGMLDRARAAGRRAGLINVSSTMAVQPVPYLATYTASKMFILMYTQALAAELRSEPVDVLALCPGATRTSFGRRAGFVMGAFPGAVAPRSVAREGLHALGRRRIHALGAIGRAMRPGLSAQNLVTEAIGIGMRAFAGGTRDARRVAPGG